MAFSSNELAGCEDFPVDEDPTEVLFLPKDDSPEQWIKHNRILKGLQHGEATRFTREVKVTAALKDFGSLRELVKVADTTFCAVAKECGARVVDHNWKLVRKPREPSKRDLDFSTHIPLGYALAADTEVLRRVTRPTFHQGRVIASALTVRQEDIADWRDGREEQFVQAGGSLVLVDIDPLIVPFELRTT